MQLALELSGPSQSQPRSLQPTLVCALALGESARAMLGASVAAASLSDVRARKPLKGANRCDMGPVSRVQCICGSADSMLLVAAQDTWTSTCRVRAAVPAGMLSCLPRVQRPLQMP